MISCAGAPAHAEAFVQRPENDRDDQERNEAADGAATTAAAEVKSAAARTRARAAVATAAGAPECFAGGAQRQRREAGSRRGQASDQLSAAPQLPQNLALAVVAVPHWIFDVVDRTAKGQAHELARAIPRYCSIPAAASRPSNTAVTTRSEPRTMSPPANTLGLVV